MFSPYEPVNKKSLVPNITGILRQPGRLKETRRVFCPTLADGLALSEILK